MFSIENTFMTKKWADPEKQVSTAIQTPKITPSDAINLHAYM